MGENKLIQLEQYRRAKEQKKKRGEDRVKGAYGYKQANGAFGFPLSDFYKLAGIILLMTILTYFLRF
jgi:hypothetical protein